MIDRTILSRYTRAFVDAVIEKNLLDQVEGQLAELDKTLNENPLLGQALQNPLIAKNDKKAILSKILGDSIDALVKNFLFLLVDKKREEVIPFLYEEFSLLADEKRNVVKANVESACSLSSGQLQKLTEKLSEISGKKVIVNQQLSTDMIGGLVITMGSKIIDASITGRLQKVKESMLKA